MDDEDDAIEPTALRKLIAKNVATLLPAAFRSPMSEKGIKEIRGASDLSNGMVGRVVTPSKSSFRVDVLADLAKALKVQPWQLLLPDLSVSEAGAVISIEGMKARQWPFPTLERSELEGLSPAELVKLEKTMRARIQELKEDRPSSPVGSPKGKSSTG